VKSEIEKGSSMANESTADKTDRTVSLRSAHGEEGAANNFANSTEEPGAGKPHAAFEAAGAENGLTE
jgi:hypothetical protein